MDEVVRTYVRIERLTDFGTGFGTISLGAKLDKEKVIFSDDIDYTTDIGGGITPTLEVASVVGKFKLTKATFFGQASRKDIHSVTVALAQDGEPVDLPGVTRMLNRGLDIGRSRPGARGLDAVVTSGARAETRVIYELERRRLIKEDERLFTNFLDAVRNNNVP